MDFDIQGVNHIDPSDIIKSFANGTTASFVTKNGTEKIIPLQWIKSS